jgi:hypothetical protein
MLAHAGTDIASVAAGGGIVVASTFDGRTYELDPQTLDRIGPPFPGATGIGTLNVDETGRRLMIAGDDGRVRLYDIATRTQLGLPIDTGQDAGELPSAILRGDGLLLAMITTDGIVSWDLDPARWQQAACELAGRNLTDQEWNLYIGDLAPYRPSCG